VILKRKLRPPGLPRGTIARNRLDDQFSALLEEHEAIAVLAAAGSGKTVQAQMFAARFGWPLLWVTLDRGDRSAARLVSYLAQAAAVFNPGAPRLATDALEAQSSVEEVAAMLAESLDDRAVLIVFDDCEALVGADEALAVLGAFLDYVPVNARTLLLSREELEGPIGRMMLHGRVARVSDADLALNYHEAHSLLLSQGQSDRDLAPLLEATNGWIAGFAFDVRADLQTVAGLDALAQYLNSEVLARLPEEEQDFLLRTSLLPAVTARGAAAMCGKRGYLLWKSLISRHLPATIADRAIVYHPRFREFLREQLHARLVDELEDLRERYARHLVELDLHEEAVEAYLEAGQIDNAADVIHLALPALYARADWIVVLRWLDAVGAARVEQRPQLLGAQIRSLYGVRRIPEAQNLIRRLHQSGMLADVAKADPAAVAYTGYTMQWRPAEALALIREYEGDYRAEAVRYELEAVSGRDPVVPPAGQAWMDMERIISWGLLVQGRLDQVLQMLPADRDSSWGFYRTPYPLLALLWQGDVLRARSLFDDVPDAVKLGAHTDLWFFLEAWLLWAEGEPERALQAAEAAVEHSRKTHFGWEPCFDVVVGKLLLEIGRIDDARSVLADSISRSAASGMRAYVEWAQTFQGLAFLRCDRPNDAVRVLRQCVADMRRSSRRLMLPTAAAYLAEAEDACGNAEQAAAAAGLAIDTATNMGSFFMLQQAVREVPGVLKRQVEVHDSDRRWRRLVGHRATAPGPKAGDVEHASFLDVQTHGAVPDLLVNGTACNVRRIKVLELAAYLALHVDGVERHRLQERLFPDADLRRGGNYFRQVVHKLRQSTGLSLARSSDGMVRFPDDVLVDSTDRRFERLLAEADGLAGTARLDRLTAAMALVEGAYLAESDLDWAETRRYELEVLATKAAADASELAIELGEFELARHHAEMAIARDPFCEAAYCILLRVEGTVGSSHTMLAVYQRLTDALQELDVEPAASTRELLNSLRNA
jgi:ATP/maltotriose-dependent transcriptional regulator MalT/DNA-binding SARP family transcriptional activator